MLTLLTDKNFKDIVENSKDPFFVDFWSEWCGPCKVQMPIVEELSEEYNERLRFGKMEVGENTEIPSKYAILSIPALVIFNKGKICATKNGLQSKNSLRKMIQEVLKT